MLHTTIPHSNPISTVDDQSNDKECIENIQHLEIVPIEADEDET